MIPSARSTICKYEERAGVRWYRGIERERESEEKETGRDGGGSKMREKKLGEVIKRENKLDSWMGEYSVMLGMSTSIA